MHGKLLSQSKLVHQMSTTNPESMNPDTQDIEFNLFSNCESKTKIFRNRRFRIGLSTYFNLNIHFQVNSVVLLNLMTVHVIWTLKAFTLILTIWITHQFHKLITKSKKIQSTLFLLSPKNNSMFMICCNRMQRAALSVLFPMILLILLNWSRLNIR